MYNDENKNEQDVFSQDSNFNQSNRKETFSSSNTYYNVNNDYNNVDKINNLNNEILNVKMSSYTSSLNKKIFNKNLFINALIVILIFALGFSSSAIFKGNSSTSKLNISPTPETQNVVSGGVLTGVQVAEKVTPSVVTVSIFKDAVNTISPSGYGSGIIMSQDGYIITNAHVVDSAALIKVVTSDKKEYEAKVVGSDVKTDIAVLKISANNLQVAEFGDSSKIKVGEEVMAIGNPADISLAGTVTKGIISGTDRQIESYGGVSVKAIQTDAAINPGNSGGPLVNMYGQVIGINSTKIAATSFEGIGFAIPITDAKPIIDNILQYGYVKDRVKLGIQVISLDEVSARLNNVPIGAYIRSIDETSNLYKAGVRQGDIIVKFNNIDISDGKQINNELLNYKPGDKINLTLYRKEGVKGSQFQVSIVLQEDVSNIS